MKKILSVCVFVILIAQFTIAQKKKYPLYINNRYIKTYVNNINDKKILFKYLNQGYFFAKYDSVIHDTPRVTSYFLNTGKKFHVNSCEIKGFSDNFIIKKIKNLKNRPLSYSRISHLTEVLTLHLAESGYPFANINIKIDTLDKEAIVVFYIVSGKKYKLENIVVKSDEKINKKLVEKISMENKGNYYYTDMTENIDMSINNTEFYKTIKNTEIEFHDSTFDIYVYVKNKKANTADGLLGISTDEQTRKIQINGNVKFVINNVFDIGETFYAQWQKFGKKSQSADISISFPYIFRNGLSFSSGLQFEYNDSAYFTYNISSEIGKRSGKYIISALLLNNKVNGNQTNITSSLFGISWAYQTAFLLLEIGGMIGKRLENNMAGSVKSLLYFDLQYVNKKTNLSYFFSTDFKSMQSSRLNTNEFFRIGGINTFAGSGAKSIATPFYLNTTCGLKTGKNVQMGGSIQNLIFREKKKYLVSTCFNINFYIIKQNSNINIIWTPIMTEKNKIQFSPELFRIQIVNKF